MSFQDKLLPKILKRKSIATLNCTLLLSMLSAKYLTVTIATLAIFFDALLNFKAHFSVSLRFHFRNLGIIKMNIISRKKKHKLLILHFQLFKANAKNRNIITLLSILHIQIKNIFYGFLLSVHR